MGCFDIKESVLPLDVSFWKAASRQLDGKRRPLHVPEPESQKVAHSGIWRLRGRVAGAERVKRTTRDYQGVDLRTVTNARKLEQWI